MKKGADCQKKYGASNWVACCRPNRKHALMLLETFMISCVLNLGPYLNATDDARW